MVKISEILKNYTDYQLVVKFDLPLAWLDFSESNTDLLNREFTNTALFNAYVFEEMLEKSTQIGIGGYLENRVIYRRSEHFKAEDEARSIHLGIDIWAAAGTEVFAPLAGKIHSFANNNYFGDYGPTVILEHEIQGQAFYTLYGHLSEESLVNLAVGQEINAGQQIATFGDFPINGDWPPHLHFQIIEDLQGKQGDYPGVCKPSEMGFYQQNCPDPNLILRVL